MIQYNYTGIGLKDWNIIIQKQDQPREIKVTIHSKDIPEMKEVDNVIQYLGEEGFLDYEDEPIQEETKLQVGYLPKYKFKALETIIKKNITNHG